MEGRRNGVVCSEGEVWRGKRDSVEVCSGGGGRDSVEMWEEEWCGV